MKKFLGILTAALIAGTIFTGCASKSSAPTSVHPREYTFDLIDGVSNGVLALDYNQYGPNYQGKSDLTNFVKKDIPLAGDTVNIKMRAVSDIDLPVLFGVLVDPSAAAGYWKQLAEYTTVATDIVAGEPFDIDLTFDLSDKQTQDFTFMFQYDTADQEAPAVNAAAKLTLERVCESTDTRKEVPSAPHVTDVDVNIGTTSALVEFKTNHPWENGVEIMNVIENYRASVVLNKALPSDLPVAGDTIHFTWKAKADADIKQIIAYLVDQSEAAAWWKELSDMSAPVVIAEDIKNGEPFECSFAIPLVADPIKQINLVMSYDVGAATPDGSAIAIVVRD